jgi:hypothetical protein
MDKARDNDVMKKDLSTYSALIGHRGRFVEPRGIMIDLKKSWAPPGSIHGCQASS